MNIIKALPLIVLIFSGSALHAKEIADIDFAESINIPGVESALKLNGLGIRSKFFFKIYIAALYVQEKTDQADKLINSLGAKRMMMHILYDEIEKKKMTDGWLDGFESNLSKTEFLALKPEIEQFNAMFADSNSGDVILLDFIPGLGTRITIKGQEKGLISKQVFYPALLKIWLGEKPISSSLKKDLLSL